MEALVQVLRGIVGQDPDPDEGKAWIQILREGLDQDPEGKAWIQILRGRPGSRS